MDTNHEIFIESEKQQEQDPNNRNQDGETSPQRETRSKSADDAKRLLPHPRATNLKAPKNNGETLLFSALDVAEREEQLITDNAKTEPVREKLTALHWATITNFRELVTILVQHGADSNSRDGYGRTPLHYATPEIAKILLDAGADASAQDRDGNTPLHLSVIQKNRILFWTLLPHTSNLNNRAQEGMTPLITAVNIGMEDMIIDLMRAGADVDATDRRGMTALHWATYNNCLNLVIVLLEKGPNLNIRDDNGCTPLHYATVKTARKLLDAGADAVVQGNDGRTPLHCAVANKDMAVFRLLLPKTTDLNTRMSDGTTPLMSAVQMGLEDMTIDLISAGADVNATDHKEMTALHRAVLKNRFKLANELLLNRANLSVQDSSGCTALHYAKAYTAKSLIYFRAEANIQNNDGFTPLHSAVVRRNTGAFQVLLPRTKDLNTRTRDGMTPLITAAYNGMENIGIDLINAGADVNAADHNGTTALHMAALHNRLKLANALLQRGVNMNVQDSNCCTALHYAKADIARSLIYAGADANIQNSKNLTPLHLAVKACNTILFKILLHSTKNLDTRCAQDSLTPLTTAVLNAMDFMVYDLIKAGADVGVDNGRGMTALHWLANFSDLPNREDAASRRANAARMLLDAGADANAEDNLDNTPLHIALKKKAWSVFKVLLQHKGTDLNTLHASGKTLLMMILESDSESKVEVFEDLIEAGVSIHARDNEQMTALHYAAKFDKITELIKLVDLGADVDARDCKGQTPLFVAAREGNYRSCFNLMHVCCANGDIRDNTGKRPVDVASDENYDCIVDLFRECTPAG